MNYIQGDFGLDTRGAHFTIRIHYEYMGILYQLPFNYFVHV